MMFLAEAVDVRHNPFLFDTPDFGVTQVGEFFGTTSMLALNWLVCATMYQLTVSIRVIVGKVDETVAEKRRVCMYIFASVMVVI